MFECRNHLGQFPRLLLEGLDMPLRDPFHIRAGAASVAPKRQKPFDLFDGKPEVARPADEAEGLYVLVLIDAVARMGAQVGANQTDILVLADHLDRYTRGGGCFSDIHGISLNSGIGSAKLVLPAVGRSSRLRRMPIKSGPSARVGEGELDP